MLARIRQAARCGPGVRRPQYPQPPRGPAMPIRFRCVYCDKLLGIAKRKAGAVVNCPQCGQPLIVPTPEPEPEPEATAAASQPATPPAAPGKLFEQDDFDVLLEPDATYRTPDP